MFLIVVTHEFVHMIDGYSENIAVCFGFVSWERSAFVINGENYALLRGEPLAYLADLVLCIVLVVIFRKGEKMRAGKK